MNDLLSRSFGPWQIPLVSLLAVAGGLTAGILARRLLLPLLARAARRSSWKYDDMLVEAARGPVVIWGTLLGLRLAVVLARLPARTERLLANLLLVLGVLSVTWFAARVAGQVLSPGRTGGAPAVTLLANLVRALLFAVGVLIVLDQLGISITPIITALGVGGLAVGLALQDTLANFFAGIRILAAGTLRVGDFVKLDSGEEGFIQDIAWGQTTVRQLPNNLVIVPNAKLAQAVVLNYTLPDPPHAVVLQVGVAYGSDLDQVERVTIEVGREVMASVAGGDPTFETLVRFHTFADSSVNFSVVLRATRWEERHLMVSEFYKRLHARYRREGIEIPFPVRTVHLHQGGG